MATDMFMIYQINDAEKNREYRCRSYAYQIEHGFMITADNYEISYCAKASQGLVPAKIRENMESLNPDKFKIRKFGVSDVIAITAAGKTAFYYVDKESLVKFNGFQAPKAEGGYLILNEAGYQIEGQTDTWKVIDEKNVQEQRFVQLVCEQTKKQRPDIILHDSGVLVAQTIHGFDSSVMKKIEKFLREQKPELLHHQKFLENAKDISKKVWTSLQRKKEAGYAVGSDAPFGYIRNPVTKRNEIDPETAFYVQLIFQWVLMGVAIFEIARRLTLLQVPTPREWHRKIVEGKDVVTYKKWGETSVRHMLANQTYVGDTVNNKSTRKFFAGQDKRNLSKEQWHVTRNTHPAIIARDDFEKVKDILAKNQKVYKEIRAESEQIRTEYQNDLAGMVFCADCGRPMDFDRLPHGAEESKKVCYYICRARQADDKCIGHQITEKLLKALVMDQLHLFIVRLSDKRKVLEELRKIEDMQNPIYRAKSEIMSLTDKVGQIAKKREQLYADYVAGAVDSEDYQLIREDYSKQYDGLRAALQRAEAKKVEVEQQIREYLNMTSNLEEHLDDFGFDAQLVKSLVQRIEVSADKRIRIVFGFQDVFADLGKESAGK